MDCRRSRAVSLQRHPLGQPGNHHRAVATLSAADVVKRGYAAALAITACGSRVTQSLLVISTLHRRLAAQGQDLIDFDDHRIAFALWISIQLGLYGPIHDLLS